MGILFKKSLTKGGREEGRGGREGERYGGREGSIEQTLILVNI